MSPGVAEMYQSLRRELEELLQTKVRGIVKESFVIRVLLLSSLVTDFVYFGFSFLSFSITIFA